MRQVMIKVTKEILDHNPHYMSPWGCAIFLAMKEAEVPVQAVGGTLWTDVYGDSTTLPDGKSHLSLM